MKKVVVVRYSEIALKGMNRPYFENKLVFNIKDCLKKNNIKFSEIKKLRGRILIYLNNREANCLKNVFGISSFSYAFETELNIKSIEKIALKITKNLGNKKTFKVNTRRSNKNFKFSSLDVNKLIGEVIRRKTKAKVKLENPDLELGIEIYDKAYLFIGKVAGLGGLPVSTEGRVLLLIEDKNSLLAGFLVMKRGCSIIPISFKNFNISLLRKFSYGFSLRLIKINKIKEIDEIASKQNIKVLVVGQILNNFKELDLKIPILRPLIGYNQKEINRLLYRF